VKIEKNKGRYLQGGMYNLNTKLIYKCICIDSFHIVIIFREFK